MEHKRMKVAIFGGATPQTQGSSYQDAYQLGQLLARAGYVVLTGGYIGVMEAASRGACEAGGHVIGVTCQEVETWRSVKPNAWVKEEWRYNTLHERLLAIIDGCDSAVAMPGGVGTLSEISIMWNRMLIDAIPHRPLILVGPGWRQTIDCFYDALDGYVAADSRQRLAFVPDVNEAFSLLQQYAERDNYTTQL
jgi:uncharacterized protein (TIGR00730 family)